MYSIREFGQTVYVKPHFRTLSFSSGVGLLNPGIRCVQMPVTIQHLAILSRTSSVLLMFGLSGNEHPEFTLSSLCDAGKAFIFPPPPRTAQRLSEQRLNLSACVLIHSVRAKPCGILVCRSIKYEKRNKTK